MSTGAVIFMVICLGGYLVSFTLCSSKVFKNKDKYKDDED